MLKINRKTWISLYFLSLSIPLSTYAVEADKQSESLVELSFISAEKQIVSREQIVNGVVEAVNNGTLKAQTAGHVVEINFDVDDFVEKGQLLARIRADEQSASTAQVKAQVTEAQAYHAQAKKEFKRIEAVFDKGAISESQRDQAQADLKAAQARLSAAVAASKRSKTQQGYTEIRAPYSGVVVERHIEEGEVANVGSPIMTGMSLDQLRVVAFVSQSQVNAIRRHQKARVLLHGRSEQQVYHAVNFTISPQADQRSHTFKVRVNLAENVKGLFPGMHVKTAFTVDEENVLLLPNSAIAYRGEVRGVYLKNQLGSLSMCPVRLGARHGDLIEVLSGVALGEEIALNPVVAAATLKAQYVEETIAANMLTGDKH
jgi:RND family efflux transporter MFP subunit